jgi:SagB-type dehydrogenase family enzyme
MNMKKKRGLNRSILIIFVLLLSASFQMDDKKSNTMTGNRYPQNDNFTALPEPRLTSGISVEEAMLNRRSIREFKDELVTIGQVSQILWSAYGITDEHSSPSFLRGGLRTAPSAGGLYPLEIYLVAGKVTGLSSGIYKYHSENHSLELISKGDVRKELAKAALNQEFIEIAPATIFFAAVFSRTTQKYGSRGRERYVCMDLGHSAQNVYLQAYALNLGTCAVGAFTDDMVSMVMQLPEQEEPLYLMPIGKY